MQEAQFDEQHACPRHARASKNQIPLDSVDLYAGDGPISFSPTTPGSPQRVRLASKGKASGANMAEQ